MYLPFNILDKNNTFILMKDFYKNLDTLNRSIIYKYNSIRKFDLIEWFLNPAHAAVKNL